MRERTALSYAQIFFYDKNVIIVVLVIIVLLLCGYFLATQTGLLKSESNANFVVDSRATETTEKSPVENPLKGRNVYFSGIEDAVINKETIVQLENAKENLDYFMEYEVVDVSTGEVVFTTDKIPSGKCVEWVPGETMEAGVYDLALNEFASYYDQANDEFISLSQGCNTVTLEIIDQPTKGGQKDEKETVNNTGYRSHPCN